MPRGAQRAETEWPRGAEPQPARPAESTASLDKEKPGGEQGGPTPFLTSHGPDSR